MVLYFLLRCAVLFILGLLIYAQTFRYDFVFDDHIFIVTNPFIKNFTNFHLMWQAFPLTRLVGMLTFAINYHFNQLNPWGYHVFNFTVHLIATGMVWALSDLIFKAAGVLPSKDSFTKELPFIIAVIFLVHPCQTQAVTYITQRFESMATVFYLGTITMYIHARRASATNIRIAYFVMTGFFAVLGMLTKEVFITVPAMIMACEWILLSKRDSHRIYFYLIAGGTLLYLLFTKLVHANLGIFTSTFISESHDGDILTPVRYFLTQMRVLLTFLRLLILPIHQNLDYDYPASTDIFHPPLTLGGAGMIVFLIWLIYQLRRSFPLISFGLAWIVVTFSINLVPRPNVIFEHKLYLISFGFILAAVISLSVVVKSRSTLMKILGCLIAILAVMSFQRNKIWANELLLWEDSIKYSSHKARVNASLGRMYGSLGRYDESIDYLSRSLAIHPDCITYENRGVIFSLQGHMKKALDDLNKSISLEPKYPLPYIKRAWVYHQLNNNDAAIADLFIAINLDPYFTDAYLERGIISMGLGHNKEALKDFERVLKIDPFNTQAAQYRENSLTKIIQ